MITTASGRIVDVEGPRPDTIEIEDIAGALSKLCRFNGHCSRFYSVAEHSVLVSRLVPGHMALLGLLHDAAEAYLGDLTHPVKRALGRRTDWWRNAEQWLDRAIRERFDLRPVLEHEELRAIKRADLVALATERAALMPNDGRRWPILDGVDPQDRFPIYCHTPDDARTAFLERFRELHRGAV